MTEYIAERNLHFSRKGQKTRHDMAVKVGRPFIVPEGSVSFTVDGVVAGCEIAIIGLDDPFIETTYGADLVQALQMAIDVDPVLKRLSKKYDFFFTTGEPYFDEN